MIERNKGYTWPGLGVYAAVNGLNPGPCVQVD
jgi:hypothetical protein